ncbi:ATP-dependent DNA helicase pfh1 [Purpureocillium lavendulum]|uniref:ATP-dependent DNA helicase pfh1 n=1 Tax=Purpureocillium lavendulum TaxID=1247861 RepID=A0AB34FBD0_9HYPO|nr:ATP-dependent DNA helicase pfh1 [Purpureocillium lavendulum]
MNRRQSVSDDIQALSRFANAQIVAFRKILKKYRKWTGSTTLTSRFNDIVLGSPKSFSCIVLTLQAVWRPGIVLLPLAMARKDHGGLRNLFATVNTVHVG